MIINSDLSKIQLLLLAWFNKNKRSLPWRKNTFWYNIFLSEIILQQTTVNQGLPYYEKFLQKYPDIQSLARADEQEVLLLWAGLGYYTRARNLLKAAKIIVDKYNGAFPDEYSEAIKLPGIGPYSASAILSIAFNQPLAVVDGNVIRVICRLFAIKNDTRNITTIKRIKKNAEKLLPADNPGSFNEAMMELGALICSTANPKCSPCPLNSLCQAFKTRQINNIPFKSKAPVKHKKHHLVGVFKYNSKYCIVRRPAPGLLAGMWEFPSIDVSHKIFKDNSADEIQKTYAVSGKVASMSNTMTHIYSHIHLTYKAILLDLTRAGFVPGNYVDFKWISISEMQDYAIHNAHKKIIEWLKNNLN